MSESESEDEDVLPKAICSPALSERSSVTTLDNQENLLAIEADPYREKVFKIATELLTTERSYVAILHLIDQVIVHSVYLSYLSAVAGSFCHCCPTDVQRAVFYTEVMVCQFYTEVMVCQFYTGVMVCQFYTEVMVCQFPICSRLSVCFDTVWSCLVFKCYQTKCLQYFEGSGLPLLLIS